MVQILTWYKSTWQSSFLVPALIAFQWNLIASNFQIDITFLNAQREVPTYRSWRKQTLPRSAPADLRCCFPCSKSKFSSGAAAVIPLGWCPGRCRAGPGAAAGLSWTGRTVPDLPQCPLPAREVPLRLLYLSSLRSPVGFHASENQLSCWISKAVFASSLCVCVCVCAGRGLCPHPRVICTISHYPSKGEEQKTAIIWQSERQIQLR